MPNVVFCPSATRRPNHSSCCSCRAHVALTVRFGSDDTHTPSSVPWFSKLVGKRLVRKRPVIFSPIFMNILSNTYFLMGGETHLHHESEIPDGADTATSRS